MSQGPPMLSTKNRFHKLTVNNGWQLECLDPFVIRLNKLEIFPIYALKESYFSL